MTDLWLYLAKMLICSGLLFGYYRIALYNEQFHQWNRFYLLAAMLLSLIVPLLSIPLFSANHHPVVADMLVALPWNATAVRVRTENPWSVAQWTMMVSAIVSMVMLAKLAVGITVIYRNYRSGSLTRLDEIDIILTDDKTAPFSFFKWLFWRTDIEPDSTNGQRMLQHELTHIAEKHSWDKMFCELLLTVFWMNPFFWLMRKELDVVHEFLADRKAIGSKDGSAFAAMILQAAHAMPAHPVTNPFFSSQLKRRLYMITNSKQPQYAYLRRISGLFLMVLTSVALAFTIEKVQAQTTEKPAKPPKPATPSKPSKPEIPLTPYKPDTLIWVKDAAIAPSDVKDITVDSKSNQVFITTKNGNKVYVIKDPEIIEKIIPPPPPQPHVQKLSDVLNPMATEDGASPMYLYAGLEVTYEQLKSLDPNTIAQVSVCKGAEAVKKYGEKGKNGVVNIIPKIEATDEKLEGKLTEVKIVGPLSPKPAPLYVIDGVKTPEETLNNLHPSSILSIDVLKGDKATTVWGEDGKNGVIIITTKKATPTPEVITKNTELNGSKPTTPPTYYEKVFTKAEQMPQFPGGTTGWRKHLEQNLRYPDEAQNRGIAGVATVEFIVAENGSLTDFKIVKDPGAGLGNEALRVLKEGPKWEPAIQNGHKVNARVTKDITFLLE